LAVAFVTRLEIIFHDFLVLFFFFLLARCFTCIIHEYLGFTFVVNDIFLISQYNISKALRGATLSTQRAYKGGLGEIGEEREKIKKLTTHGAI
jgi:hypothetical protein